jgi:hypothetical protein
MYIDKNPAVLFFIQSQKFNYLTLSIPYEEMTGIETQEEEILQRLNLQ